VHDVPAARFGAVDALKLSHEGSGTAPTFLLVPSSPLPPGLRLLIVFARGNPTTLTQGTALGTQFGPKPPEGQILRASPNLR
jgi:hypothetical protein